jgi:hypothetical protein
MPDPDPRCVFHLAVAYLRIDSADLARKAMERAWKLGFDPEKLFPDEELWLLELQKELGR